jgi:RNA polymerase-interacting CarD/CdnL/TRCF family regulator
MKDTNTFKVGDKIVHFGEIYLIFEIKKQKTRDGQKEEPIICFRPYFGNKEDKSLICSIPVANIEKTDIRKSISKKELKQLLKELSKKLDIEAPIDINKAKEKLILNSMEANVQILKKLWREKKEELINFTKTKSDLFETVMKRLAEEIAFVGGSSLVEARKKIKTLLSKGHHKG